MTQDYDRPTHYMLYAMLLFGVSLFAYMAVMT